MRWKAATSGYKQILEITTMSNSKGLARRLRSNGKVQLPNRPRRVDDLLLIPTGTQEYVVQSAEATLFKGQKIQALLTALLPLLDGSRNLTELQRYFPKVKLDLLDDVLALLYSKGMTEEGFKDTSTFSTPAQLFYSRYNSLSRATINGYQTNQIIRSSRLALIGEGRLANEVYNALASLEPEEIQLWSVPKSDIELSTTLQQIASANKIKTETNKNKSAPDLLVVALENENPHLLSEINSYCLQQDWVWLPVVVTGEGKSSVGPLVEPGVTACYQCWLTARSSYELSLQSSTEVLPNHYAASLVEFACGQAALESLYSLTGLAKPVTQNAVLTGNARNWKFATVPVLHLANCPACGVAPANAAGRNSGVLTIGLEHQENLIRLYHLAIKTPPSKTWSGISLVEYEDRLNQIEEHSFKSYGNLLRYSLPQPTVTLETVSKFNLETVTNLLYYSFGSQHRIFPDGTNGWRRLIPTGGSLGSPRAYLIALEQTATELPSGIYHYATRQHSLERLPQPEPAALRTSLAAALGRSQTEIADYSAAIILTGGLGMLEEKYNLLAYRIVNLDSGVAIGSLRQIAGRLGLNYLPIAEFYDEQVATLLQLFNFEEIPLHIALLATKQRNEQ
jgi:bacteriocin biosynthesis cyclodehydratase domain-containing protein